MGWKPKGRSKAQPTAQVHVGFNPGTGAYIEPDYKGWARDHGIEQRGRDEGLQKFPPSNQLTHDGTHVEIHSYVTELATTCRQEVTQYLGDLMASINAVHDEAGLEILKGRAKQIAEDAKGDYDGQAAQDTAELKPALEQYRAQEAGLAEFRRTHGLGSRLAEDSKHREAWLWIVAIMIAESAFNGFMLADVSPSGLVGALSMTVIITAVNVLTGVFFIAEGWRDTNSVRESTRARGYSQVIVLVLLLIAFNILVAHGRDAMQILEAELRGGGTLNALTGVSQNAWAQFLEAPFTFESFKAPLLMVAGFVCFLLASWKGYERDDWYPGYGAISRMTTQVREDYQARREEATEALRDRHNESGKALDDLLNEAQWKRDEYQTLCDLGRNACKDYPLHMERYNGYLAELLQMYRDANVKARQDEPAPEYFGERMALDGKILAAPEFDPPPRPDVAELAQEIGVQRTALQAHYDNLLATTYPPR